MVDHGGRSSLEGRGMTQGQGPNLTFLLFSRTAPLPMGELLTLPGSQSSQLQHGILIVTYKIVV